MCMSLAACGGPDRQPAIDEFNEAAAAYDAMIELIGEDTDEYPEEALEVIAQMGEALTLHKQTLESDQELTEEKLNEMIEWYNTVDQWVVDIKADLGIE